MSSERQLLDRNDPWWGEHVHRYNEVVSSIRKDDFVLDLACGTGFGSDIIAQHTQGLVIGGDIATEVINECNVAWKRSNLQFEVLDGTLLPYPDAYFDKIVSFETIEHTTEYKKMLQEFFRALKPGGSAFISTPNFPVNSPSGKVTNPYHTQEFTFSELKNILDGIFTQTCIAGQKYSRYDEGQTKKFGKIIELFFGIMGIRKLPYHVKTGVSTFFTGKPFYPTASDFTMVMDMDSVLKCKTFFCVCRK